MGRSGGEKTIQQTRKALEKKGMQFVSSAMTIEAEVEANNFSEIVSKTGGINKTVLKIGMFLKIRTLLIKS